MLSDPKRYIAIQATVEFVANAALNAAIGWYWTQGLERVPLWGWASVAVDLLSTGFGIGLTLSLILTWRLHRRLRAGATVPLAAYPGRVPAPIHRLPFHPAYRSLAIGIGGAALALVLLLILQAAGVEALARQDFIAVKTAFGGAVAVAAMLAAGYRALGDGVTPQKPQGYWPDRHVRRA